MRYPILVIWDQFLSGKTEFAHSLFRNAHEVRVGRLEHFPDAMRGFNRRLHDGLILDDVRDVKFLSAHQEKLQARYNGPVEFGSTPGGQCAFWRDLFAVPVVATDNYSTDNLGLLDADDWLGNTSNRVVVHFPHWEAPPPPPSA